MPTVRASLAPADRFASRHIGPSPDEVRGMLATVGYDSLDAFIDAVVPAHIRLGRPLQLPPGRTEREVLQALRGLAAQKCQERPPVRQARRLEHRMFDHPVAELRPVLEQPCQHRRQHPGPPPQQGQGQFRRGSGAKNGAFQLHA